MKWLLIITIIYWSVKLFASGRHRQACQPEQIHIAFGDNINDIVVTWSTMQYTNESLLQYGEGKLDNKVWGKSQLFIDGGSRKAKQWIHVAYINDLKFDTKYVYIVGSHYGWSREFSFTTPPAGEDWTMRAVVLGDLGTRNARSLPYLKEDVARGRYDVILHAGDFAYDFSSNNGRNGNLFMNSIQPIAGHVPYMVCPGNHEEKYNFSDYRNRFSMPGLPEKMFFSFNMGPVHFVSINTEAYYDNTVYPAPITKNKGEIYTQYNWLVRDLEEANQPENRKIRPWIIMYGHRPFFCSNSSPADQCNGYEYPHRVGIKKYGGYGLEPLLKEYGIDLVIWGHEHSYERMWPVYDGQVYNGSYDKPYVNPRAPVHVTSGSAGCDEFTDRFFRKPQPWSAFRSSDYGYARLYIYNSTHLYMEQLSTHYPKFYRWGKGDKLLDSFWLVKDSHKPYHHLPMINL